MITIPTDIAWPETLPLPFLDVSGNPRHAILASPQESAAIIRRLRFSGTPASMSVRWILGLQEYIDFKDFFLAELDNGTSCFSLPLLYPKNSELTDWVVRFVGPYTAAYQDHNWEVFAQLDLVTQVELSDVASPPGTGGFIVLPDGAFYYVDGHAFYVQTEGPFLTLLDEPFILSDGHPLHVLL